MAFPQDRRSIYGELYIGGTWTDVTSLIYQRNRIQIVRGYRNEAGQAELSTCSFTLNNRSSNFSPRNPTGSYYGTFRQSAPLRLGVGPFVSDTFTRSVSNGWGSATSGQAWSGTGIGGTVQASDFQVTGSVGTQSVPTTSAYRISYLATTSYRDVEVVADVSLSFTDVTGGTLEPNNICLRGQSTTNYYLVRVTITTAEAITISLMHFDGTVIAAAVTVSGLTHSSSQTLRVRAQAEGQTLRAKVWAASGSEPYGWHVTGHSEQINAAGWVGIRNGVGSGNTNTKPIVFTVDNFAARLPRFAGELAEIRPQWDTSGRDITTEIQAAGILRRLSAGASAVASALRRGLLSDAIDTPVAYWPCEDGIDSTRLAAAIGGASMYIAGSPDLATNSDFACSAPLPECNLSIWQGSVPSHTLAGRCQVRMLVSVPGGGVASDAIICEIGTVGGTIRTLYVVLTTAGSLQLLAHSSAGAVLHDSGVIAYAINGVPKYMSVEFEQIGANVDVNLVTLSPGATTGEQLPGGGDTVAAQTIGIATYVRINTGAIMDTVAIGHISVHNVWSSLFALGDQLAAWDGETAGDRIERLCGEEGVSFGRIGDLSDTSAMGVQLPVDLLALLQECVAADLGLLTESKGELGLHYRTRTSLYNQTALLDLDYTANELSEPFAPVDDDQLVANDVTVKRDGGSEARAILETGAMSVLPVADGGRGRYPKSFTVNVQSDDQLPDLANWLLHLYTVDEQRYPQITVDLARSVVITAAVEEPLLSLWLGDRLTISNPKSGQTPDQISQLVIGYSETLNAYEHRLTLVCVPESPYRVMELDSSTDSRVDSDSSTLTSNITSSATSFQVSTSSTGDLWITTTSHASHFPVTIKIGGETMSVGAISSATSPQTFSSVTRSVNGVVKAHSAGAEVHVAAPVVLAL